VREPAGHEQRNGSAPYRVAPTRTGASGQRGPVGSPPDGSAGCRWSDSGSGRRLRLRPGCARCAAWCGVPGARSGTARRSCSPRPA